MKGVCMDGIDAAIIFSFNIKLSVEGRERGKVRVECLDRRITGRVLSVVPMELADIYNPCLKLHAQFVNSVKRQSLGCFLWICWGWRDFLPP